MSTPLDFLSTAACVCGEVTLKILATFDPDTHEMETFSCDGFCPACGRHRLTPLPIDFT